MNEWGLDNGEWRDSNPHGKKVHDFIMTYPEWAIYIRRDPRFKCPDHWDESAESFHSFGDTSCWCWGLGVAVTGTIIPTKFSRGRTAEINPLDGEVKNIPGFVDITQDVIHMPRGIYPQVNDIVLCCEWNTRAQKVNLTPPKARPIRIHSIYVIRQINSYFQRELSHLSCGCETYHIQEQLANNLILNKLINLPVMDVEQTWQQISYWSA